jgi:hypothetical protein
MSSARPRVGVIGRYEAQWVFRAARDARREKGPPSSGGLVRSRHGVVVAAKKGKAWLVNMATHG